MFLTGSWISKLHFSTTSASTCRLLIYVGSIAISGNRSRNCVGTRAPFWALVGLRNLVQKKSCFVKQCGENVSPNSLFELEFFLFQKQTCNVMCALRQFRRDENVIAAARKYSERQTVQKYFLVALYLMSRQETGKYLQQSEVVLHPLGYARAEPRSTMNTFFVRTTSTRHRETSHHLCCHSLLTEGILINGSSCRCVTQRLLQTCLMSSVFSGGSLCWLTQHVSTLTY